MKPTDKYVTPEKTPAVQPVLSPTSVVDFEYDALGLFSDFDPKAHALPPAVVDEVTEANVEDFFDAELTKIDEKIEFNHDNFPLPQIVTSAYKHANSPVKKPNPCKTNSADIINEDVIKQDCARFNAAVTDVFLQQNSLPFYKGYASPSKKINNRVSPKDKESPLRNASAMFNILDFDKIKSLLACRISMPRGSKHDLVKNIFDILSRNLKYQKRVGDRALPTTSIDTWFTELDCGPSKVVNKETGAVKEFYHHHCIFVDVLLPLRKLYKKLEYYNVVVKSDENADIDCAEVNRVYDFCVSVLYLSNELLKQLNGLLQSKDPDLLDKGFQKVEREELAKMSPLRAASTRHYHRTVVAANMLPSSCFTPPSTSYATSLMSVLESQEKEGAPGLAIWPGDSAKVAGKEVVKTFRSPQCGSQSLFC